METFTLDPRCWRFGHILGRNPLLRRSDRIEALVVLAAVVVSLGAIPVAGVVGGVVYGACHHRYAREAHERHVVTATVADARITHSGPSVVQARWPVAAGERTGSLQLNNAANGGERIDIWVDKDGNPVPPPTPTWDAVGDGFVVAMTMLWIVGLAIMSLVLGVRARLDGAREALWDRELRCLEEDGGRTNQR